MTREFDVIVIGAGLAGLAAGATATQAGADTLVLDAHTPGGRARVTERDGFVFNMGAHALYRSGPGMEVLKQLGVAVSGVKPPLDRYSALAGDQTYVLPASAGTLLRTKLLGARDKAAVGALLARLPKLKAGQLAGTSVDEWLAGFELRPTAEAVVRALLRIGTYADDFSVFGADAALTQMQAAASTGVWYLDGGWAQLIDGLAAECRVEANQKVTALEPAAGRIEVRTQNDILTARSVIVAAGNPTAVAAILAGDPGWGDLGPEVTAACLDAGVRRVPDPGYLLGIDQPLYTTVQSPPARMAPDGQAVVASLRYGTRNPADDRADLEAHMLRAGVAAEDVVTSRFLARMVVTAAAPRADRGGLTGRPSLDASGLPGVFLAGDWVGGRGLLADASLASGHDAALKAVKAVRAPAAVAG